MTDPRFAQLARQVLRNSIALREGEKIFIDLYDTPDAMAVALIRETRALKAIPLLQMHHARVAREMAIGATPEQFDLIASLELARMKRVDAYIAIRGGVNISEMSDVPGERLSLISRKMRPVLNHRVNKTRWCVLRWPTASMAQLAGMSSEAFEDFYFHVCTLDHTRMRPGMEALRELMERTDKVEIRGPGTELRFSIKGIGAVACGGTHNIPDGEVFSCPVKDSVEGYVTFNAPTIYLGSSFDHVRLEFEAGKIVKATSNDTKRLNQILDSDAGARYIGEFALGFNPYILHPMRDILFDEKIAGSFHFTPGQAYEKAGNGNTSQVHWDLVAIQRRDYGGGEVWFDDVLIRKDGLFVPTALRKLNPQYLVGNRRR